MGSKPIVFLCLSLAVFLIMIASEVAARDLADTTATATSLTDTAKESENKNEVKDAKYPLDGYGGRYGGGYGGYPGGGRGGYPGGGYGGYGGYCRYGCCYRSYYGRGCRRCCAYKGEAMEAEPQAKPHN